MVIVSRFVDRCARATPSTAFWPRVIARLCQNSSLPPPNTIILAHPNTNQLHHHININININNNKTKYRQGGRLTATQEDFEVSLYTVPRERTLHPVVYTGLFVHLRDRVWKTGLFGGRRFRLRIRVRIKIRVRVRVRARARVYLLEKLKLRCCSRWSAAPTYVKMLRSPPSYPNTALHSYACSVEYLSHLCRVTLYQGAFGSQSSNNT